MCNSSCICEGIGKLVYICSRCVGSDPECKDCLGKGRVVRKCPKSTSFFESESDPEHDEDACIDFHRS